MTDLTELKGSDVSARRWGPPLPQHYPAHRWPNFVKIDAFAAARAASTT